ncbi:MAG: energy-coupled thiamine transporter ThiT, partial [Clostridia bacterium]|nr:energy-coupled thiamine transporter ThiT [Clostridia bacterium]
MQENSKKYVYKLTLSAVFVALATALSLIKVYELPLGGSVTLLSMLPIVMISCMLGLKWGFGSAFVYSL